MCRGGSGGRGRTTPYLPSGDRCIQIKLSISQANCRLAASPNPRSIQLFIAELTTFEFTIFANVAHIGASRDSRNTKFDWDCYKIGGIFYHGVFTVFNFDNRSQLNKMHVAESQRVFLDIVQDALKRYDTQLKDINHKVSDLLYQCKFE